MTSISSGIVTIMFTDLVGHTSLYDRMGQAGALELITSHFRLLREVLVRHSGREVKSLYEGDSLMVAFPTASAALKAAVDMQQAVRDRSRSKPQLSLSMRIGVNTGELVAAGDDLFGTAVVLAKRLCDEAQGGQILVSEAAHAVVRLQGEFSFSAQGLKELKGIAEPVHSYALHWEAKQDASVVRTILFTDIVGFTTLSRQLGNQEARQLLRSHNAIVREHVVAHGGVEVKSLGAGFMVAFQSANRAVRCAMALQRSLTAHSQEQFGGRYRVRMGLDTGEVMQEEGDLHGECVMLAYQITDRCRPGEILVSSRLKDLAEGAGDIRFSQEREVELKGVVGPQRVFKLVW